MVKWILQNFNNFWPFISKEVQHCQLSAKGKLQNSQRFRGSFAVDAPVGFLWAYFMAILTHKFLFKSLNRIWFWLGSYDMFGILLCVIGPLDGCRWTVSRAFSEVAAFSWKQVKIFKSSHTVSILSQPVCCFPSVPRPTIYPFLLAFHLLALEFSLHKTVPGYKYEYQCVQSCYVI